MLAGDPTALRVLYEHSAARVFGVVRGVLSDQGAAEEALEETYLQAWRKAASFDARRGTVLAWLVTMARTRAIDLLRVRGGREARERKVDGEVIAELAVTEHGPLEETQRSERAWLVHAALESLPEAQASAIRAAFFDGLSHTEVARALGEPLGTVKTRIRSGLSGLRVALEHLQRESA
jgi:RNA polymerase sigma-70 factor (ECF subfamily)